jgi:hypothetical protein
MYTFDRVPRFLRSTEVHVNVNPADDKNAIVRFNFASDVRRQPAGACIDFARFQRAPKGSYHSTAGGRYDVIESCGMGFSQFVFGNPVMLRNWTMDAEPYRDFFTRQIRNTQWPSFSPDVNV